MPVAVPFGRLGIGRPKNDRDHHRRRSTQPSKWGPSRVFIPRIHKNGNAGKIRIKVEAGNPVWKTITQDVDVPIVNGQTEETLKTLIYTKAAESKAFIEEVEITWSIVNNFVDGASGFLGTLGPVGTSISGAVDIVRAMSAIEQDLIVDGMNDNVKATFATQRNEIEKEYERLQPGLPEDDDAATDIAQFNALY